MMRVKDLMTKTRRYNGRSRQGGSLRGGEGYITGRLDAEGRSAQNTVDPFIHQTTEENPPGLISEARTQKSYVYRCLRSTTGCLQQLFARPIHPFWTIQRNYEQTSRRQNRSLSEVHQQFTRGVGIALRFWMSTTCRIQNLNILRVARDEHAHGGRRGEARKGRTKRPRVGSPRNQPSLLPSKRSKNTLQDLSLEPRTKKLNLNR